MDFHGLQRLLWNFADFEVVVAAGRTGLLRRLENEPGTANEVADDLGFDRAACRKVMGALAALGLLHHTDGVFRLDDGLVPLFAAGDDDLAPFLEHSRRMADGWARNLTGWLESGTWPHGERTPEQVAEFGRAMQAMGRHTARLVVAALDLDGVGRILDLGGGRGHFARTLCRAAGPDCRATVVDVEEVAQTAADAVRGTLWQDRLAFVAGDYAEEDGGGGFDLVLLANVLHQEGEERAARMVANAARAARPGGRVVVVDFAIDDERSQHRLGTLFAVNMRHFGDTWTEPEIRGWMADAGLREVARTDLGPDRWLIQGVRPE